jgi:hypothetical protein
MSKHTPGPWFSQYDDNGFYEIGSEAVSLRLAFTHGEGDTDEANARLIAAAPELLEALKDLLYQAKLSENEGGWDFEQATAAIAKAEGQS